MKQLLALFVLALLLPMQLSAQFDLFGNSGKSGSVDRKKNPVKINADAMDIDLENNKAILMGNVIVDDPQMYITCRKMTIYLTKGEKGKKEGISAGKPSKIVCSEDVTIIQKSDGKNTEQKALAGQAVYDLKLKTVTLTEKPILIKGGSQIHGERITMHLDSRRAEIVGGRIISNDLDSGIK